MPHVLENDQAACPDEDALAAFVSGCLEEAGRAHVERHLGSCERCYQLLGAYARAWAGGFGETQRARALAPGAEIGRYVLLRWLGEGGLGVVYSAYDPELDRRVALKLVHPRRLHGDPDSLRARLLREARAMAKIAHPNVVAIHDVLAHEGQVLLAMEFVRGGTLREWLQKKHDPERVVDVFVAAGRGLAAAHAAGLAHRDFKPENVLMGEDGRARVTDFGLAALLLSDGDAAPPSSARPDESAIAGTPAYMAPEQRKGAAANAGSDQFSFAVALYEALSGARPFDPADDLTKPPAWEDVPSRLRPVLARALRERPEDRYASMDDLLAALAPPARHRRLLSVLVAALVLSLGGLAWISTQRARVANENVCAGADEKLRGAWDDDRRRALEAAFNATGKPYAADVARRVRSELDAYAAAWVASRVDACRATYVRHDQSAELLDLRVACLDRRRDELAALVDELVRGNDAMFTNAVRATESLSRVASCDDTQALTARVERPSDPAVAKRVAELRSALARLKAMGDAGRFDPAVAEAARLVDEAKATGVSTIQGEALYRHGHLLGATGDLAAAKKTLYGAAWAADAAGDDRTRVAVWTSLLYLEGYKAADVASIPRLRDQANAAMKRLGRDDELRAELLRVTATTLGVEDKYDEAVRIDEELLALQRKLYGDGSLAEARSLSNMAHHEMFLGRIDKALEDARRAAGLAEATVGPRHPATATNLENVAVLLNEKLAFEEAAEWARRAVAIAKTALGPRHADVANPLCVLAFALVELGRFDEALAVAEEALSIYEERLPPSHFRLVHALFTIGEAHLGRGEAAKARVALERAVKIPPAAGGTLGAEAEFALSRALVATGGDRREAERLAVAAQDAFTLHSVTPRDDWVRGRIAAWLERLGR